MICKSLSSIIFELSSLNCIELAVAEIPLLYVKNFVGSSLIVFLICALIFPLIERNERTFPSHNLAP
jgi:hypothetical protein